jgi:N-acetylglucosamine malate deacetylase 2
MSEVSVSAASAAAACPAVTDAPFAGLHVAMVVAHPDDEVLGAGGQFASMRRLSLIHLTDGAPSDRAARWHGCADRRAYIALRAQELADALRISGTEVEMISFSLPDQQATFHLAAVAVRLADVLADLRPDIVLTHPYEGGHPDHDAAAFIAAAALQRDGDGTPLWEFTSYHAGAQGMVTGGFLPYPDVPVVTVQLDGSAQRQKRGMRACFRSQQEILAEFPNDRESFRRAPVYDFTKPPHPGRLLYETRRRAWTGAHWRWRAQAAAQWLSRTQRTDGLLPRWPGLASYYRVREVAWRAWLAI